MPTSRKPAARAGWPMCTAYGAAAGQHALIAYTGHLESIVNYRLTI
jgi:hypothetical protein